MTDKPLTKWERTIARRCAKDPEYAAKLAELRRVKAMSPEEKIEHQRRIWREKKKRQDEKARAEGKPRRKPRPKHAPAKISKNKTKPVIVHERKPPAPAKKERSGPVMVDPEQHAHLTPQMRAEMRKRWRQMHGRIA